MKKTTMGLNIPQGIVELPSKPVVIKNAKVVLGIGDTHFPFHDKQAIEKALNYRDDIDTVILLGDMMDIYSMSYFSKDPSMPRLREEIEICKQFLVHLRRKFPTAQIIYYEGNHEIRINRYVYDKAPALYGIEAITLTSLLDLKKLGISFVENGVGLKVASLSLLHGNEAGSRGGINIARTMLLKTNGNCAFGNFHKTQESSGKTLDGEEFANWAVGCLCQLKPRYMPINQWNLGFFVAEIYGKEFEFHNKRILSNYNVR